MRFIMAGVLNHRSLFEPPQCLSSIKLCHLSCLTMSVGLEAFRSPVWKSEDVFPSYWPGEWNRNSSFPSLPVDQVVVDVEMPQA